jgi:hypothetical protein
VDFLLLPAALAHVMFPRRVRSAFSSIVTDRNRVTLLTSAADGFVDLPFVLMALICCASLLQSVGMVGDVSMLLSLHCTIVLLSCTVVALRSRL